VNYYPFHIGDYLSATRHLSWEEDAAFRRLLDTYYTNEKPLPTEMRAVCRLVLATTESQREAVHIVLQEFFVATPEGWINRRADAEIDVMREKQQKQRDRANKRWHKPEPEQADAPAMPRHTESDAVASQNDANAMPPTPTPTPTPTPVIEEGEPRKRSTAPTLAKPADVEQQTWADWLTLRKAKRAPVTQTTVDGAREEAAKADMSLEVFLKVWCRRGSQGLEADWLKPSEKPAATTANRRVPALDNFAGRVYVGGKL
jgi:uncharacterized protein YdaU (DUF1376 family)